MASYATLNDAMVAADELAEAEIRYRLLAEAFEEMPQLRSQLNTQVERAKAEILRLRALRPKPVTEGDTTTGDEAKYGQLVSIDASRFRKTG